MQHQTYPVIDLSATGRNIRSLRVKRGLSVGDLQSYFNFNEPRSIYKWEAGQCLPSIDNLYALSVLLRVPIDSIIVGAEARHPVPEPQDEPAAHHLCLTGPRIQRRAPHFDAVIHRGPSSLMSNVSFDSRGRRTHLFAR